jgi:ABC-type Fe3+-siderophore transport system permease subunit
MKAFFQSILALAVGGGLTGASAALAMPNAYANPKIIGYSAAAGAATTLLAYLLKSPIQTDRGPIQPVFPVQQEQPPAIPPTGETQGK